jgi:hypothetical protein
VAESARTGRAVALPTGPASRLTAPVADVGAAEVTLPGVTIDA